jgi:hypothetical protein
VGDCTGLVGAMELFIVGVITKAMRIIIFEGEYCQFEKQTGWCQVTSTVLSFKTSKNSPGLEIVRTLFWILSKDPKVSKNLHV